MPVSHIGLTVSRLPTSCSFFAAVLQPLGYKYLGEQNQQIGFGVNNEADFFLCQESFGQRSGASHIAFNAPSRSAVDQFYSVGLKSGGRTHQEPATRDPVTGQYSASIIDFDNNAVEVVYRPGQEDTASVIAGSSVDRITGGQTEVARSIINGGQSEVARSILNGGQTEVARSMVSAAPSNSSRSPLRTIVNGPASTAPGPAQAPAFESKPKDNSLKTLGTLCLGAAAGVAVAYAMTKAEEQDDEAQLARSFLPERSPLPGYQALQEAISPARSRLSIAPRSVSSPTYLGPSAESCVSSGSSRYRPTSRPLAIEAGSRSTVGSTFAIEAPPGSATRSTVTMSPSHHSSRHGSSSTTSSRRRSNSQNSRHSLASPSHHSVAQSATPSAANFPLPRSVVASSHSKEGSVASSSKTITPANFPLPRSAASSYSAATGVSRRSLQAVDIAIPRSVVSGASARPSGVVLPDSIVSGTTNPRTLVPENVPLPRSSRGSVITAVKSSASKAGGGSRAGRGGEVDISDLGSVAPSDSVSQVSSKRSRKSHRHSKGHSSAGERD